MVPPAPVPLDPHQVAVLHRSHAGARKILDFVAGHADGLTETTVDLFLQETGIDRAAAIDALRHLAIAGCGEFIVGRRGAPTRFRWITGMDRLAEILEVGAQPGAQPAMVAMVAPAPAPARALPRLDDTTDDELALPAVPVTTHRFQLRPDLVIELRLPSDLSVREAERLGKFIDSLPFE